MHQPIRLTLTTPATIAPVSLSVAKQHLRIEDDATADEALIAGLIQVATDAAEDLTHRALLSQTWTAFWDTWPGHAKDTWWDGVRTGAEASLFSPSDVIELPRPPLQSVVHVKTYDDADAALTWAATNYFVDTAGEPGRIVRRTGATVPTIERVANGLEVQFVAGYGDNPGHVPEQIRQGVLLMVAHLYEHRGDAPSSAAQKSGAATIWQRFRVFTL